MLADFMNSFINEIASIRIMLMVLTGIIHVIFASAVARDSGKLMKQGYPMQLVSGLTWAFATLVGGVFIAVTYWFLHHAKLFASSR